MPRDRAKEPRRVIIEGPGVFGEAGGTTQYAVTPEVFDAQYKEQGFEILSWSDGEEHPNGRKPVEEPIAHPDRKAESVGKNGPSRTQSPDQSPAGTVGTGNTKE